MFVCYICNRSISQDTELIRHLRNTHALYEGSALTLHCCLPSCVSTFKTFSGFRRHIKKCSLTNTVGGSVLSCAVSDKVPEQCSLNLTCVSMSYDVTDSQNEDVDFKHITCNTADEVPDKLVESYVSKLYALGIPDTTIQLIVNCTSDLFEVLLEKYPHFTHNQIKEVFHNYRSKHIRNCHFNDLIVKPVEVPIGVRFDQKWNKTTQQYNQVPVTCTYTYIPILETLQFLLKNKSFLSLIRDDAKTNSPIISDYCHGSNFRNNSLFSENQPCLQIQLYFDEFETVNPLGSKTGGHKLGAVYFIIRNLPNFFNSTRQNIHLLALYYSADVKSFGINKVLDKIVSDIKQLEAVGIYEESLQKFIRGSVVAISHDNLGGNQIFGLVESFSSRYFCRICLAEKNTTQSMCEQNDTLLRTTSHYEQLCSGTASSFDFGIKFRSILNDLAYFKIFENVSADVMHDILEGIGQLEIKLFLKYLLAEKVITLQEINKRLKSFNFGYNEMSNKPSPINLDKTSNLIGERAAQTWCLLRFLPLLLGDIVVNLSEKQKDKFKVITLLLSIMSIVFCPVNTYGMIFRLRELISTHHYLFQKEYNYNLTPKHHFLVHYPMIIQRSGPLSALWCMRFESKHSYFKDLCNKLKNFKSLSKTLALRHQQYMWHEWQHVNLSTSPSYGKCNTLLISDLDTRCNALLTSAFNTVSSAEIIVTESVTFLGCSLRKGRFITKEVRDDALPIFLQINCFLVWNNLPYALCVTWETVDFNETYHAYIINKYVPIKYALVKICSLKHVYAYELHHPFNSDLNCIVPKFEIVLF